MSDADDGQFSLLDMNTLSQASDPGSFSSGSHDVELARVRRWFGNRDPRGRRMAKVMRESLDQVLDGPRTGRFRYSDLRKTEKTHVGTIVEINLGKEFDLPDGDATDYRIDGIQVDCKYSMSKTGWAIPIEAIGHLVLLTWADDDVSRWSAGLWRVNPDHLNAGGNRDRKRTIARSGRIQIDWLWHEEELDENLLLHLPKADIDAIFRHVGKRNGQKRINELFRRVRARIVRREVVLTVAQQKDGPRRARMAREPQQLGQEGIIVLGHYTWDVEVAEKLGLPVPKSGEWVSVRVTSTPHDSSKPTFDADGNRWAIADEGDVIAGAPKVPRSKPLDLDM